MSGFNRAGAGNNTNLNRGNLNNTNINRGNLNNTNINRGNLNNTNINRGNFNNTNINRGNFNNTNINRGNFNNAGWAGRGAYGGWAGRAPYAGYHSGWVNGYWGGHYGNGWGMNGFGWGLGLGLTTGLLGWGLGSALYNNWGYSSYYNPYYGSQPVVIAASPYNYAQPINTQSPPPQQTVTDQGMALFESARSAFLAGDYPQALQLTDQALAQVPNDPSLHEFRALVLFALKRYDEAAASLYAVLSVGPGWDWTTMVGLYPGVEVYTAQLRDLEAYVTANPGSAQAHFVLAYHYLTQGNTDAGITQLQRVAALEPNDKLAPQLIGQFSKSDASATPPANPTPVVAGNPGKLAGAWTANPSKDSSISLTFTDDGGFLWRVTDKGQPHDMKGQTTYGNDLLTLAPTDNPPLVGKVTWQDPQHFTFQAAGGGPNDPGLAFSQ
jgi:tetratricopeptide (TPR) repeat protein